MTTGRRPTYRADDLADTIDEADQPREVTRPGHDRTPSGRIKPAGVPDREPYFDAAPDEHDAPANVDLHGRMTLLEQQRHADARRHHALAERVEEVHGVASEGRIWVRRGVKVLGSLGGLAVAALIYLLAFARASGDATATAREREIQRVADHALLLEISRAVAGIEGELRARNPLGMRSVIGPVPAPATTEPDSP